MSLKKKESLYFHHSKRQTLIILKLINQVVTNGGSDVFLYWHETKNIKKYVGMSTGIIP